DNTKRMLNPMHLKHFYEGFFCRHFHSADPFVGRCQAATACVLLVSVKGVLPRLNVGPDIKSDYIQIARGAGAITQDASHPHR
ncbi:hypothetical protein, partial [uncultured Aliiroseovarius sp.]|uniref:hypothetical protein n=1 Tax=uncultured Aliiroseovarius sp. TaxID=1658783 RepID=UPI00262DB3CC